MKPAFIAVGFLASAGAFAETPHISDGMLVDQHGMTLYQFGGTGAPDAKSCEGDCQRNFPPALAQPDDKATKNLSLQPAKNGGNQWAYRGKRLYRGAMDKKPGDTHGDGLNTVWHVVRPK